MFLPSRPLSGTRDGKEDRGSKIRESEMANIISSLVIIGGSLLFY
jgi:hypothetical protein